MTDIPNTVFVARRRWCRRVALAGVGVVFVSRAFALPFGTPDPRSLAMGGTGVVTAGASAAAFHNPSLLAGYARDEDEQGVSSITLPVVSGTWSDTLFDAQDFADSDYDLQLSRAIADFNTVRDADAAQNVANVSSTMAGALNDFVNEPLPFDVNAGLTINVPSIAAGGSFFVAGRAVGGGLANMTDSDRALLDAYIDGMTFVATGGQQGVEQPQLFTNTGELRDLTGTLDSTVSARGLLIAETGVALAYRTRVRKRDVLIGATPKLQAVSSFDFLESVHDNNVRIERATQTKTGLNLDLGVSADVSEQWRWGATLRNLVPRSFETTLGNQIKLEPQLRVGAAYTGKDWLAAVDLDVTPNAAIGPEEKTQMLGVGGEWYAMRLLALRAGYRFNLHDFGDSSMLSVGAGVNWKGFSCDVAYGFGTDLSALSAQLGFAF